MNDKKDYSLLRPFDLEAAKAGELLIDSDYDAVRFVGSATKSDEVCVEINSISLLVGRPEDLFMAPLAWVEGRPVYKGDKPYCDGKPVEIIGSGNQEDSNVGTLLRCLAGGVVWSKFLTWQKPKVRESGWAVIDKSILLRNEESAKAFANSNKNFVAVYGEWEE